ncbi:MAG: hypothetical protein J7J92_02810 [Candidatus Aenigmarchaeota archaeon]|nr:hypothetical protein [Candidatus Aenigmarchaeota archaeon]
MKFIIDISNYNGKNERITGFKKMHDASLNIPTPIKILTHEGFLYFKKYGMKEELKNEIKDVFKEIKTKNPKKGVAVRRAYFVPGLENPPGPRSSAVEDLKTAIENVKKILKFAIENKFDKKGSEIEVFFHPFINPKIPSSGGCVTPNENYILIEAIYGNDESVQSFPHDKYKIDIEKKEILNKKVEKKEKTLSATGTEYREVDIPKKLQTKQVLTDEQIIKIAEMWKKLSLLFGPHRLEFDIIDNKIFFIECTAFKSEKLEKKYRKMTKGYIKRIKTDSDINNIRGCKIIFIDPEVIRKRKMGILTKLACTLPKNTTILFPGSATTAHASIIFREMGHNLIYTGNRVFKDGEKVRIEDKEEPRVFKDD